MKRRRQSRAGKAVRCLVNQVIKVFVVVVICGVCAVSLLGTKVEVKYTFRGEEAKQGAQVFDRIKQGAEVVGSLVKAVR